jgi:alginate O-acetyltransferase complex protein AlgI
MLFNSFSYLLFLPLVFTLYWLSPVPFRKVLLLLASYIFYMSWKAEYGLLLLGLTVVNFGFGRWIDYYSGDNQKGERKRVLVLGLIFNLGCLCFYKYANLLLDTTVSALHLGGKIAHAPALENWSSPALNILLPLGISFFTFEFIHYIVDIHRGSAPIKSFKDFALFASFFPSQIAGPIKRFQDFRAQMETAPVFKTSQFREGIFLILQGLFKKVVLGDNLGLIVNHAFSHVATLTVSDAWIGVVAFMFQVFFDFSGYTDIGRGSALLLGYKVPENFNLPYLAASPGEFWQRWHLSLSTWLRDYLYIPLGGSRGSEWKVRRNLFITMALGGLWHGASWRYMVWGIFHGIGLIVDRVWKKYAAGVPLLARWRTTKVWHWAGVTYTILFLLCSFVIFRSNNLQEAGVYYGRLFNAATFGTSGDVTTMYLSSTILVTLPLYGLYSYVRHKVLKNVSLKGPGALLRYWDESFALRLVTCAAAAFIIVGCAPSQIVPFIYFQF